MLFAARLYVVKTFDRISALADGYQPPDDTRNTYRLVIRELLVTARVSPEPVKRDGCSDWKREVSHGSILSLKIFSSNVFPDSHQEHPG